MTQKRSETPDEILLRAMGGRVERPGESLRIVAECWTCKLPTGWHPRMVKSAADKHRAAGHDVREVKG